MNSVYNAIFKDSKWRQGRDRMVVEFTICAYLSSNPTHGEVYLIQHYMMNFVSDLRQVSGFLRVLRILPPINWPLRYNWNINESGVKHHNPNLQKIKVMHLEDKCN
jgi:hypothetical protein